MKLTSDWPDGTRCAAVFSDDERHRYLLSRTFPGAPDAPDMRRTALFLMLNPSTATHEVNDPTITRCVNFTKAWGYNELQVANLFSLRSTNPRALKHDVTAEGDPCNLSSIVYLARHAAIVVCAWGTHGTLRKRNEVVLEALIQAGYGPKLRCIRETKSGHPEHPLYLPASLTPQQYGGAQMDVTHV